MVPDIKDSFFLPPMVVPVSTRLPGAGPTIARNGFIWGVRFKLPDAGHKGGFVVQRVQVSEFHVRDDIFIHDRIEAFWEAWPVEAGATNPLDATTAGESVPRFISPAAGMAMPGGLERLHDWWAQEFEGQDAFRKSLGRVTFQMIGCARFFERESLPATFKRRNVRRAGDLFASTQKPAFWIDSGHVRYVEFSWELGKDAEFWILRKPNAAFDATVPSKGPWENHSKSIRAGAGH